MRRFAPLVVLLAGCVTTSNRDQLIQTRGAPPTCTEELTGAMDPGVAPAIHLELSARRACEQNEVQTWSTVEFRRLDWVARWFITAGAVVALLAGTTTAVAVQGTTDTSGNLHFDSKAAITAAIGYPLSVGLAFLTYELLGIRLSDPGPPETQEVVLPRVETTHAVEGTLRLPSGKQLPLVQSAADVDAAELNGELHVGAAGVLVDRGPSLSRLLEVVPKCRAIEAVRPESADPQQINAAAECAHAGWLIDLDWNAKCRATLGKSCSGR